MKNKILLLALMLTVTALSFSCKKEQVDPVDQVTNYSKVEYQFYITGESSALGYFEVLKSDGYYESFSYANACYNIQDEWEVSFTPNMTTLVLQDCYLNMKILSDGVVIASFSENVTRGKYHLGL